MKKVTAVFILVCCLLALSACREQEPYSLMQRQADAAKISIVHISYDSEHDMIQEEICQISDHAEFWARFDQIPCYVRIGMPDIVVPIGEEGNVLRIDYGTGDYELINWSGQTTQSITVGNNRYAGEYVFDEAAFTALIDSYLDD